MDRTQQVVVDGATSTALPVVSGVPQGSVLAPLLFLIYIDGVEKVTLSDGTIILYADDMVLYRPIYSQEDYWLLQQDINAVARWISGNHLQFNSSKCKYMTLSRKRASDLPPPINLINLNSLPLDRVTEFKYLGLRISADLSWSPHINMICAKARRLGWHALSIDDFIEMQTPRPSDSFMFLTSDPTLSTHVRSGTRI